METTRSLSEDDLIVAAQNYAETCQIRNTKEQYIKNPGNWLKETIWIDFLPENYKKPKQNKAKQNFFFPVENAEEKLREEEEELVSQEELEGDDWMKYGMGWRDRDGTV